MSNEVKGTYILLIELPEERKIMVGKLGTLEFPKGFYAYVGSALKGFQPRINRHLQKSKKLRWHIDYLLEKGEIFEIILCPSEQKTECLLAQKLAKRLKFIPGFGSSDCNCRSHLFLEAGKGVLKEKILLKLAELGWPYRIFSPPQYRNSKI